MKDLTNADKILLLEVYQKYNLYHPLTCCDHVNMFPKEYQNKVMLECPKCGRIQEEYPDAIGMLLFTLEIMDTDPITQTIMKTNLDESEIEELRALASRFK